MQYCKKQIHNIMITKRNGVLRRGRRQVPPTRSLDSYAAERFLYDDYDRFMKFCKDANPSLNAISKVSSATFERLAEQFEENKTMAY